MFFSFNFPIFIFMITSLIIILIVIVMVIFATLSERKVMGACQRRIGPNTVGIYGLLQA
jgi:NADH:ubiquinone oxidoreductase subunit H